MEPIKPEEFKNLAACVEDLTGIELNESKAYLIENRLGPVAAELGCNSYQSLYHKIKSQSSPGIINRVIDAITVNETFFFRDSSPFNLLQNKILPDLIDRAESSGNIAGRSLDIWSAACSTGQEVYSIAIILKELLGDVFKWRISILGTDLSPAAVGQASYGQYNQTEIERGLDPVKREKYFMRKGNVWQVNDEIRAMVSFKKMNLLEPFTGLRKFDLILCRNVAIYFSRENRKTLFERIANQLNPGGVLMIGSTESLIGISERFHRREYLNSVYYELKS